MTGKKVLLYWIISIFLPSISAFIHSFGPSLITRATQIKLFSKQHAAEEVQVIGVVAPLSYSGPYACLRLDFHHLKQNKNAQCSGVSLEFLLDTAANINVIRKNTARSLRLPTVISKELFSTTKSAGAGGSFEAGDIVMLGDCHLSNMPKHHNAVFLRNLTAAAIDVGLAGALCDGLFGTSFFRCFSAVEFDWYGTDGDPPTLIFYYNDIPEYAKENAFRVLLEIDPSFDIPMMTVAINGINVTAIVDTGSCISIVSPETAENIGLQKSESNNGKHTRSVKVAGIDKGRVDLEKAAGASIEIGTAIFDHVDTLFIGRLPGIELASKVSTKAPQALIGLDVLKQMYRLIVRLSESEMWFEEMPKQKSI